MGCNYLSMPLIPTSDTQVLISSVTIRRSTGACAWLCIYSAHLYAVVRNRASKAEYFKHSDYTLIYDRRQICIAFSYQIDNAFCKMWTDFHSLIWLISGLIMNMHTKESFVIALDFFVFVLCCFVFPHLWQNHSVPFHPWRLLQKILYSDCKYLIRLCYSGSFIVVISLSNFRHINFQPSVTFCWLPINRCLVY